jgi:riboflavin kinase/FMN adenylyltransferase
MRVHSSLDAASSAGGIRGLALGFFDGVHSGHLEVFRAITVAGQPLGILTFWPHPQAVLRPQAQPELITGLEHKLHRFALAGAQDVIVQPFDATFARIEAAAFLDHLFQLLPELKVVACGPNFRFGHGRTGDPAMLREACQTRGITAGSPALAQIDGAPVSSSRIRAALAAGDLTTAARLLGRPYCLRGKVVPGRRLGRQLGFPTANVITSDGWLIPRGVYAGRVHLPGGETHPAAINFGTQPTIDPSAPPALEAHLIGFQGDLLEQVVEIEPRHWLRGQQRFPNPDALRAAIANDVARAAALESMG